MSNSDFSENTVRFMTSQYRFIDNRHLYFETVGHLVYKDVHRYIYRTNESFYRKKHDFSKVLEEAKVGY